MVEVNDLVAPRGQLVCSQLQVEVPPGGRRRHQNWLQPVHVQLHDLLGPCSLPSSMGRGVGGTNRPAATPECASSAPSVVRRSGPPIAHRPLPAQSREMAVAPAGQPPLLLGADIPRQERCSDRPHGPEHERRRSRAHEGVRQREFTATHEGDATTAVSVDLQVLADVSGQEEVEGAVGGCRCRAEATEALAAHHPMGGRRPAGRSPAEPTGRPVGGSTKSNTLLSPTPSITPFNGGGRSGSLGTSRIKVARTLLDGYEQSPVGLGKSERGQW